MDTVNHIATNMKFKTIFKVVTVLTLATLAAAVTKVDPRNFRCTTASPVTQNPLFSNTDPPVALTHIFCGQVKTEHNKKSAEGFHSRHLANMNSNPGGVNYPRCAKVVGKTTCARSGIPMSKCQKCPFYSEGIEVYDSNTKEYIYKKANQNNPNKFFPDAWSAEYIVNLALNVFQVRMNGHMPPGSSDACLPNVAVDGCGGNTRTAVTIYTDGENIISAFPVDRC